MNPENQGNGPDPSSNTSVKRKRGRPRKDQSQISGRSSNVLAVRDQIQNNVPPGFERANGSVDHNDDAMVGQTVTGVIEATFDAGHLLSIRIGNSETSLRGVVFKPGHYMPVSTENDLAPQIQMIARNAVPSTAGFHTPVHGSYRRGRGRGRPRSESRLAYSGNGNNGNQITLYNETSPFAGSTSKSTNPSNVETQAVVSKGGGISQTETARMEKAPETDNGSLTKQADGPSVKLADVVMEEVVNEVVEAEPMQELKPVQAMWSDSVNQTPSVPHSFRDARAGKMTELLLAVQENLIDKQAADQQHSNFNQHNN